MQIIRPKLVPLAIAVFVALLLGPMESEAMPGYRLTITSSEAGTAFSGYCTVRRSGKEARQELEGTAPLTLSIEGSMLNCRIRADGPLRIEALGPQGSRASTATSGGTVTFSLS